MLSDEDRSILEFESNWWLQPGPKDLVIEHVLGLTATDYYQQLIRIVGLPGASRFDPLTVARVRAVIEVDHGEEEAAS